MGYKSAARSFQVGLGMGQQAKEFEQLQGLREKADVRAEKASVRAEKQAGRETAEFGWKQEEHDKKKRFEIIKRETDTAKAMLDAGDERGAAKKIIDLYNEQYPNGDEVRIIFKSDNPNDEKWNSDPNLKGRDIAVLSKSGGILPGKNMKELMKVVASSLDYGQFVKDSDAVSAKVAEANRASKPFQAHDGKMYIQQFKEGPGGSVIKAGDPVPYTGKTPMTGKLAEAAGACLDTSKLSTKDKRVLAGLREKEKTAKPGEAGFKTSKAQTEMFAKDIKLMLTPFAKPGKTLIDPETYELTNEGKGAMDAASDLWQKYQDKKPLTPQEKRKVGQARDVLDAFSKMFGTVYSKYDTKSKAKGKNKSWKKYQ
jgi:hypothetical protein